MNATLLLNAAMIVLGSVYVLIPLMAHALQRFRIRRVVCCPKAKIQAEVQFDARKASLSSVFGKPEVKIRDCTLWPVRKNRNELCVKEDC